MTEHLTTSRFVETIMRRRRSTENVSRAIIWMVWMVTSLGTAVIPAKALTPVVVQTFMTESGHAEFTSSIPLYTFTGKTDNLVGMINLADSTVDFYLDLTTLQTGIGKRDKDMRLTLNTKEYPFAEFTGTLITPFDSSISGEQAAAVRGTFSIHGVSREVHISGTLESRDGLILVRAAWELNLNDYDIVPPRLLIVKVDEVQEIRIEADLMLQDE